MLFSITIDKNRRNGLESRLLTGRHVRREAVAKRFSVSGNGSYDPRLQLPPYSESPFPG
jgi:hypothetical protein